MKVTKIIFFIISFGLSLYFALQITNSVFEKNSAIKDKENKFEAINDGDIIFQSSQSAQCEAVRIATNSKFSHCGIIYIDNGKRYVYEAVQPVKITALEDWITHGKDNSYVIKRLKKEKSVLTPSILKKMKDYGKQFENKDYDLYFEWTDNKIYCSELVWKIYKNGANIELCKLESLKNFNLKDEKVKSVLKQRYGNNIPLEEKVVAPSQIVNSELLETVIDTYTKN
jgi:uncharacterized protein YycO